MQVFYRVITALTRLVPPSTDIAAAYSESSTENQDFILSIALFLCNFLSRHLALVEASQTSQSHLFPQDFDPLRLAHGYLLKISRVDEREIFKVCVEYWVGFVGPLYLQSRSGQEVSEMTALTTGLDAHDARGSEAVAVIRLGIYADVLSELRLVVIENMAKPEEVRRLGPWRFVPPTLRIQLLNGTLLGSRSRKRRWRDGARTRSRNRHDRSLPFHASAACLPHSSQRQRDGEHPYREAWQADRRLRVELE